MAVTPEAAPLFQKLTRVINADWTDSFSNLCKKMPLVRSRSFMLGNWYFVGLFRCRRVGFFGFRLFQIALHSVAGTFGNEFPLVSLIVNRGLACTWMLGCAAIIQGFFGYVVAFFLISFLSCVTILPLIADKVTRPALAEEIISLLFMLIFTPGLIKKIVEGFCPPNSMRYGK